MFSCWGSISIWSGTDSDTQEWRLWISAFILSTFTLKRLSLKLPTPSYIHELVVTERARCRYKQANLGLWLVPSIVMVDSNSSSHSVIRVSSQFLSYLVLSCFLFSSQVFCQLQFWVFLSLVFVEVTLSQCFDWLAIPVRKCPLKSTDHMHTTHIIRLNTV